MDDEISRRSVLSLSTVLGATALAGCGSQSDNRTDRERTTTKGTAQSTASTQSPTTGSTIELADVTLATPELLRGESLTVSVRLANTGDSATTAEVPLHVGDRRLATQSVSLDAGSETTIEFSEPVSTTGTQTVAVGDRAVGDVVVRAQRPESVRAVGAHYYPWYGAPIHDWRDGEWSLESPSTPVLGNYDSDDPAVIEQHIDWCRQAGVTWLNVSWWGQTSNHDERLREDILAHPRADELEWSILYETVGQFGTDPVDLNAEGPRRQFTSDLSYLAETYFSRDTYKRIDGRPVLYVWVGQLFRGDVAAAYDHAVEAAGVEPYLIADVPMGSTLDAHPIVEIADAVTTYNPYDPSGQSATAFLDSTRSAYRSWYRSSDFVDVDVIPTAMPGFDDTELTHDERDNVPLEPSAELYDRVSGVARRYADGPVLVTSFNEWYEDTQIEPSEDHGTGYLDVTADTLATGERTAPEFESEPFVLSFETTVDESTMNPDVTNGRALTLMLSQLTLRNEQGETLVDANVGSGTDDVSFLLGSYGPEQSENNSWHWLGGGTETVIAVPNLPTAGQIELSGRGATTMDVSLVIDDTVQDETTITDEFGTYTLSFE